MKSDLIPPGQKTVIARYAVLTVLFLDFAAAVVWYAAADVTWRHYMGGEPWPHSDAPYPVRYASWALIFQGAFVIIPLCAPFLLHLFCAVFFNGAAAIYAKDGWLVCHHPLMGRIRVEDITSTRIEAQTALSPMGRTLSRNRLVIEDRSGHCRKVSEIWLSCTLEHAAQRIDQEVARGAAGSRHPTASYAFSSSADAADHTFGRRHPS